jgi:hypothetical protein
VMINAIMGCEIPSGSSRVMISLQGYPFQDLKYFHLSVSFGLSLGLNCLPVSVRICNL